MSSWGKNCLAHCLRMTASSDVREPFMITVRGMVIFSCLPARVLIADNVWEPTRFALLRLSHVAFFALLICFWYSDLALE